MDKKKYIIAIVLLIFLGLTVFTFANTSNDNLEGDGTPSTEENEGSSTSGEGSNAGNGEGSNIGSSNNNGEESSIVGSDNSGVTSGIGNDSAGEDIAVTNIDEAYELAKQAVNEAKSKLDKESYDKALDLVSKVTETDTTELEKILEEVNKTIVVTELVATLEAKTTTAANEDEMNAARSFRTDEDVINKVTSLEDEEVKAALTETLDTLAKLLNDITGPTVNIEDGAILSSATTILVEDANEFTIEIMKNGSSDSDEISNGYEVSDGVYVLSLTDSAFNNTTVTFTIDSIAPVITGVPNGQVVNHSVSPRVEEANIKTVTLTKNGVEVANYQDNMYELSHDGVYEITVCDITDKCATASFTIDKTNPEFDGLSNGKFYQDDITVNVVDSNLDKIEAVVYADKYNTITLNNGDVLDLESIYKLTATDKAGNSTQIYVAVDKTAPVFTTVKNGHQYTGEVTINVEDLKVKTIELYSYNDKTTTVIENGHVIKEDGTYAITATDYAGRSTKVYVKVDNSAPVMTKLQVYNKNNTSSEYVKNGDTVRVLVTFDEKLGTLPTLTTGNNTVTFKETSDGKGGVIYSADIIIPEDEKELKEGILAYTISGYKDVVGNEGAELNETLAQMTLTYDRTSATFTLSEGTIGTDPYSKLNVKLYDANGVAFVEINGTKLPHTGKYVDINDGHAYTFIEGENVITVTDKAGNVSTITYVKDTTAPTLPTKEDTVGTDSRYSRISFKPQDNMLIDYYVINGTKVDLTNNWISDANYENINQYLVEGENTIVLYDAAGNKVEKTFYMDWTNPGYNYDGIMNIDQVTEGYAKVGDRIWVYAVIDEYVSEEPTITINGVKAKIVQTEDGAKFNDTWYKYVGEVVMTEEMEEGKITFTIDGYKDLAGNPGETLTNTNINKGLQAIILDKTAPNLVVKNTSVGTDSVYSRLDMQALDTNLAYITINGTKYSARVDINDGHIQSYVEGANVVTAVDKAGNVTEKTFTIDRNLTIANNLEELKNAINSCTNVYLAGDIVLNEKLTIKCDIAISGGSIIRDVNYTGNLFTVNKDVTLTLNGTVIDGNNNWTFDYESYNDYLKNMKSVTSEETSHKFTTLETNKPVATTDMFIVNGNLNLSNVTIKNHAGVGGASVITDGNNATQITMTNTKIEHCTTPNSATVVSLEKGGQWTINEGTVITENHAGSNGGIVRVNYATGKVTMNGGKVTNNTSVNSNGTFIMMWNQATFEMNGGEVSYNSGVAGWANGRNAAIYGHSKSHTIINGGSINNNISRAYGGIDAPYASYEDNATVVINGGNIINNVSIRGNANKDLHDGYLTEEKGAITVNGGTFTQDVSKWVSQDKTLTDNGNGTWTVK